MAGTMYVEFVMLHGRELRAASAALQVLHDLPKGTTNEDYNKHAMAALDMCWVALAGIKPNQCIQVYEPPETVYREVFNTDKKGHPAKE